MSERPAPLVEFNLKISLSMILEFVWVNLKELVFNLILFSLFSLEKILSTYSSHSDLVERDSDESLVKNMLNKPPISVGSLYSLPS
jgi:hypothetical protein